MERAASPPKAKTSAICSSKSWRLLPFTLMKAPLLVESASTSSATPSWFRREVAPGHLGNGGAQSAGAAGLLGYQADWLSRSPGPGRSAGYGADASESGRWHTAEYPPSGGRQPLGLSEGLVGCGNSSKRVRQRM